MFGLCSAVRQDHEGYDWGGNEIIMKENLELDLQRRQSS